MSTKRLAELLRLWPLAVTAALLATGLLLPAAATARSRDRDRDRDGLSDRFERRSSKTNPKKFDTDRDGLGDGYELRVSKTNPRRADSDRDGISDGDEVRRGSNPRDPKSPGRGGTGNGGNGGAGGTGTQPGGGGTPPAGGTTTGGGTPPDTTAPVTAILTGTAGAQASTSATFTFTADETSTFQCRLDGAGWTACTSPRAYSGLADGAHTFEVRAKDSAGNVDLTPATNSWTVDATAPNTTITAGPLSTTTATTAELTFTADETGSTFQCRLDSGAWDTCGSPKSLTDLALGTHTFEVRASDAVGNTDATPAQRSWTIELPVPDTTITGGPSGTVFEFSATLSFSASDAWATFECRLNGSQWTACTSPTSYLDLLVGDQTFEVRAKNSSGVADPTPATRRWTVEDQGGGIS